MFSLSPKAGKKAVRQEEFPVTYRMVIFFVLFRPSTAWIRPIHIKESNLLSSGYRFKSQPETPSQAYPEYCLTKYLATSWPSQVDT